MELEEKFKADGGTFREYKIGDLFRIVKGRRLTKADMKPGNVNFLGAISTNNGIREKIATDSSYEANCISVNYNGSVGCAFYQEDNFWASDDVNICYANGWEMSRERALYLCCCIQKCSQRFSYTQKWTVELMRGTSILLPVTSNKEIAFGYMERYIREIEDERLSKLDAYLKASGLESTVLTERERTAVQTLRGSEVKWGEFKLGDLFEPLKGGFIGDGKKIGAARKTRSSEYHIPLTCAKIGDNGIMYWAKDGDFVTYTNTLSVIADGVVSAGLVYAQPEEAGAYSHSYFIKVKTVDVTPEMNLFLSSVLTKVIYPRYSRERTPRWERISLEKMFLPITSSGSIDWEFMESLITAEARLAIRGVIDWRERVIAKTNEIKFMT